MRHINRFAPVDGAMSRCATQTVDECRSHFLHVQDNGMELWFAEKPVDLRCLSVVVDEGWEVTVTRNYCYSSDGLAFAKSVPPRGQHWEKFDDRKDNVTVWRRRKT